MGMATIVAARAAGAATVIVTGTTADAFRLDRATRRISLHPGAGLDTAGAVALINAGQVPTADLLGDTFPLEQFEEAFALLNRSVPGRDSIRSRSGSADQEAEGVAECKRIMCE
jgi:threonine dehydrogenase-like Zn-dependent dehydrogenase